MRLKLPTSIALGALAAVLVFALCWFVAWCGGYDFDKRNLDVGMWMAASLFISGIIGFATGASLHSDL